jgi:hypothetical protein
MNTIQKINRNFDAIGTGVILLGVILLTHELRN